MAAQGLERRRRGHYLCLETREARTVGGNDRLLDLQDSPDGLVEGREYGRAEDAEGDEVL